ncbi:hypothetical protein AAE478_000538 [Parahypoxylon ruwenzoriense]
MAFTVEANRRLLASKHLPPCDGPKLHAFKYRNASIKWLKLLGTSLDARSGCQGFVFKVEIKSKIYALKVFKFFPPSTDRPILGPIRGRLVTDEDLAFHTDPFYAECRAYGQIQKAYSGHLPKRPYVADCYGFLALNSKDEKHLSDQGINLWDGISSDDEYRVMADGSPARALVKQYVEKDTTVFNGKTMERIRKGIRFMNSKGILIRDVRLDNYQGELLVDLGSAWTKPHCILDNAPQHLVAEWKETDRVMFDDMVKEEGLRLEHDRVRARAIALDVMILAYSLAQAAAAKPGPQPVTEGVRMEEEEGYERIRYGIVRSNMSICPGFSTAPFKRNWSSGPGAKRFLGYKRRSGLAKPEKEGRSG